MLLDSDQIRRAVGLPKDIGDGDVVERIKQSCPSPDKLHVFLLDPNTERLVSVAAKCIGLQGEVEKERAIRDRVLNQAAHSNAGAGQRDRILRRVPALQALVELLVSLVQPSPSP
jgi:hypothetical protein